MKVGLVLPTVGGTEASPLPRYAEVRELALQAEDAGFDALWVPDHLMLGGTWECWSVLAALAEATNRIEIGPWVRCAHFNNPAILAKMAVAVDELSGGRLILGLGAGWHRPEFDAFGVPWDRRVERFEEALQIIVPLLREGKVSFQGTHYQAVDCEIFPRGPRPGGPPIFIGAGQPRMMRLAARYADMWAYGYREKPVSTRSEMLAGMDTACQEVGRDIGTLEVQEGCGVAYPDLGPVPEGWEASAKRQGPIAAELHRLETLGVHHAVCLFAPPSPASLARLTEELHAYRGR